VPDLEGLVAIALRVSVMYVYALAMLRLAGKRSIGQLAGPDVVATLIIGDMFDDIFWAEVPLAKGVVGMTSIFTLHLLTKVVEWRSRTAKEVFDGKPTLAVMNGQLGYPGLRRERICEGNLGELLRVQGLDNLGEVREARIEVDGAVSVLKFAERKPVQKRELEALREVAA
jgi:uncharacterized membrane protein YcaP (DUF421 family)